MNSQENYRNILAQFSPLGYNENSTLSQPQLKKALDTICDRNAGIREFNLEVAEELWNETDKNQQGVITLREFVNVVIKAQTILLENIVKSKEELTTGRPDPERQLELEESLAQYNEDIKLLTLPFKINPPAPTMSRMNKSFSNPNINNSRASQNQSGL